MKNEAHGKDFEQSLNQENDGEKVANCVQVLIMNGLRATVGVVKESETD